MREFFHYFFKYLFYFIIFFTIYIMAMEIKDQNELIKFIINERDLIKAECQKI